MYTKFIVVVDEDVNPRDWKDVIWAITTRVDPSRDTLLADSTPIDYLDFASPVSGLGSKMGLDATNKWPGETVREWGRSPRRAAWRCLASMALCWGRSLPRCSSRLAHPHQGTGRHIAIAVGLLLLLANVGQRTDQTVGTLDTGFL